MLDFAVPYIEAFKTGLTEPVIIAEMLVYWYRPHLKSAQCDHTDNCGSRPTGWDVSTSCKDDTQLTARRCSMTACLSLQ